MTISVVVIASNEEAWIAKCLESLNRQTLQPTEIIVLAHNCTDRTVQIARTFGTVRVIECHEHGGPIIARMRAIEAASGDIIACIDGDAWAHPDWLINATVPLLHDNSVSIVSGYTTIMNSWWWKFISWYQFAINRKLLAAKKHRFAWGSNMVFRKADYIASGGLEPFLRLHDSLILNYWAEDLYLSFSLQRLGSIYFALDARVYTLLPPEKATMQAQRQIVRGQKSDNAKLFAYFETK